MAPKDRALYDELGVEPDATEDAIKRAYRKMALRYHPDKNAGSAEAAEKFKKVAEAYEILSDPQRRKLYDATGATSEQQAAGGGNGGGGGPRMSADDIFSAFFGHGARGGRAGGAKATKPRDVLVVVEASLEETFCGTTKVVGVRRCRKCSKCKGTGYPDGRPRSCRACNGQGVRMYVRQMGGMTLQQQGRCETCGGQGRLRATAQQRCTAAECEDGFVTGWHDTTVTIEPGALDGDSMTFAGEGNEQYDLPEAGDILVVIEERPHTHFRRFADRHAMCTNVRVPLGYLLQGLPIPVENLDGTVIQARPRSNDECGKTNAVPIFSPEYVYIVARHGFPVKGTGGAERGDLYIPITVIMPKRAVIANDATRAALWRILGNGKPQPRAAGSLALRLSDYSEDKTDATGGGHGAEQAPKKKKKSKAQQRQETEQRQRGPAGGVHVQQCAQQ
jgi:DnaJ family protein A protein 2